MASITIPLYYDLDLLLWTSAAGGIARQPNLVLGQSDSIAFAVQFVRSGVVIELTAPQFICGIKPINDVAGDYLCQTTTGVKTGSTTSTVYTFTLLLDFDAIQQGIAMGLPEKESWRMAFGLELTLIWLYLEILRLLAIVSGRN